MSKPTPNPWREDATYLSIGDRYYLMDAALNAIEEGIDATYLDAIEAGCEPDDNDLEDHLGEMRAMAYVSLLHSMTNNSSEATEMMQLLRQGERSN